jgi:hypothetical protein
MTGSDDRHRENDGIEGGLGADRPPGVERQAANVRSGDFSHDPALDPEQLFTVIGRTENTERVSEAMRAFLHRGDAQAFERAIAVFVRSARARNEPVERVLAVLIGLAEALEGAGYPHDWTLTDLRWVILRGVLLAFYGDTDVASHVVDVERRAGGDRRRTTERSHDGFSEQF